VSFGVHREAVNGVLNLKVLKLAIVLRIIFVEYGNGSAVTSGVNPAQTRIELNCPTSAEMRQFETRS
jgi:hypothetical protein